MLDAEQTALRQALERLVDADDITRIEFFPTVREQTLRWLDALTAAEQLPDVDESLYVTALLDRLGMQQESRRGATAVAAAGNDEAAALAANWRGVLAASRGRYDEATAVLQGIAEGNGAGIGARGLSAVNLVAVHLAAGRLTAARQLIDAIRADGLGTDDPRGDILLALLEVQLERVNGSHATLRESVDQLHSLVVGALLDPDLTSVDELTLLAHLALAEFDDARARLHRVEMAAAADLATLVTQLLTASAGTRNPTAIVLRTRAALDDFEAACESNQTATAGAAIDTLVTCHQLMCAAFGVDDRRTVTLLANIAAARLDHARMLQSALSARLALDALEAANRSVQQVFDAAHPTALAVATNLGSAAFDVARIEQSVTGASEAADKLRAVVARTRELFGDEHPRTRLAMRELASCEGFLQRTDEDGDGGGTTTRTRLRTAQLTAHPGFDTTYVSVERASAILSPDTSAGSLKGRRIVGAERRNLARDLVKRYANGENIRALAASTGLSYGFVHRVLTEAGVKLRQRGGARRRKQA